jgi:hypothetical protein
MSTDGMNWAEAIARPNIVAMRAYSARGASTGALHLDANESPWAPPPGTAAVSGYNRYPAQQPEALRQRLADIYGVTTDEIAMGRGADEALDVLVRTFCEPHSSKLWQTCKAVTSSMCQAAPICALIWIRSSKLYVMNSQR